MDGNRSGDHGAPGPTEHEEAPSDQGRIRPPRQSRSAESFECFLAATYELLLDQSPDAVRVADIVDLAERPNGSFYARFSDKWAAVDAVLNQVIDQREEAAVRLLDEASDLPLPDLLERYVGYVQLTYGSSLVPTSALLLRAARQPGLFVKLRARWTDITSEWAAAVAQKGLGHHQQPHRVALTTLFLVQGIISWEHLYGPYGGDRPLSTEVLVDFALLALGEEPVGDIVDRLDPVLTVEEPAPARRPVDPPKQQRGLEAYDAFVDSLEELLARTDYDDISVSDIARNAHRSNGSFYGMFTGKEDCLVALLDARLSSRVGGVAEPVSLIRDLHRLPLQYTVLNGITLAVRRATNASDLQTTFCRRAMTDDAVRHLFRRQRASMAAGFHNLVLTHPAAPRHRLPGLVYLATISLLDQFILFGRDAFPALWDPPSLVRDLGDVALRLLGLLDDRVEGLPGKLTA